MHVADRSRLVIVSNYCLYVHSWIEKCMLCTCWNKYLQI